MRCDASAEFAVDRRLYSRKRAHRRLNDVRSQQAHAELANANRFGAVQGLPRPSDLESVVVQ